MKLSKICFISILVIVLCSCDKKSAVDSFEYARTKSEILSQGAMVSIDLYELPVPAGKTLYWKESVLKAEALKSHNFVFNDVSNIWESCNCSHFDNSKVNKIHYGVIVKNAVGTKYFMTL